MPRDVFISYSSKDKNTADAVCAKLEQHGIRCWIAPRDVLPGTQYGEAIIDAINSVSVMVVVFSAACNESIHVRAEVERAASKGLAVLPLRIEEVLPAKSLEFFLSSPHWLDAMTPPFERHLATLADTVRILIAQVTARAEEEAASVETPPPPPPELSRPDEDSRARLPGMGAVIGVARAKRRRSIAVVVVGLLLMGGAVTAWLMTGPMRDRGGANAAGTPTIPPPAASGLVADAYRTSAAWWIDRAAMGGVVDDAPPVTPVDPEKVERRAWVQVGRLRALRRDWAGAEAAIANVRFGPSFEHGACEVERMRVAAGLAPDAERWMRMLRAGADAAVEAPTDGDAEHLRAGLGLYAFVGALQAGDLKAAANIAATRVDPAEQYLAWGLLAEPLAKAGDRAGAQRCLAGVEARPAGITRDWDQFEAYADLAILQGKCGDRDGFVRVVALLDKAATSGRHLGRLARAQAGGGDLAAARATISRAETKAVAEGKALTEYAPSTEEILLARAAAGDFAGAAAGVEAMRDFSAGIRRYLADAEIAAGRLDRAERLVAGKRQPATHLLFALARAYDRTGDRAGFARMAALLRTAPVDVEALYYVAAAHLIAGDKADATRALDDAVARRSKESVGEGEPPAQGFAAYQQAGPLTYLRAWAGDLDRARADVRAMKATRERVSACLSVGRALLDVAAGDFNPPEFPVGDEAVEPFPVMWSFLNGLRAPAPRPGK